MNPSIILGYGNIAPKTQWGRVVTIIYGIVGLPLFFVWVSEMGGLLASVFRFLYFNFCCALCRRGQKRKAALEAAKAKRQEERKAAAALARGDCSLEGSMEDNLDVVSNPEIPGSGDKATPPLKPDDAGGGVVKMLAATPLNIAHNLVNNADSGVQSQQSLDHSAKGTPVKIEILQPEVKEVLASCAQYNLDNMEKCDDEIGGRSAEVLEELKRAEALEIMKQNQAKSPLVAKDDGSLDEANGGGSGSSPDKEVTPLSTRRARLGHNNAIVTLDANGSPVTTILRPGVKNATGLSREASPASSTRYAHQHSVPSSADHNKQNDQHAAHSTAGGGGGTTASEAAGEVKQQEDIPVITVLVVLFCYICLGATLFSAWENWSFLEGFYFSFITLSTIGFGDFVPGDAVLNAESDDGQAKLIIACIYVLMGLAVLSMSFSLMQDSIVRQAREFAVMCGLIPDDEDDVSDEVEL